MEDGRSRVRPEKEESPEILFLTSISKEDWLEKVESAQDNQKTMYLSIANHSVLC